VDPDTPVGTVQTATNTGSNPSVAMTGTVLESAILSVLSLNTSASTTSVTPTQTLKWNVTGGTLGALTKTQGAGSIGLGNGGTVTMSWALGASKLWGLAAIEVKPMAARLVIDAEGTAFQHSPFGINATDFDSLQAAVDSLAERGGTVHVPGGTYNATSVPSFIPPLTLPDQVNPVNIIGDGPGVTILHSDGSSADLLLAQADHSFISGLTLDGTGQSGSGRGLVVGPGSARVIGGMTVRDVDIIKTASWWLYVLGGNPPLTIWGNYERVRIADVRSGGGIYVGTGNTTQYFTDCSAVRFMGYGADVFGAGGGSFERCTFEDALNPDGDIPYMRLRKTFATIILNCWFEHHDVLPFEKHFIVLGDDSDPATFCGNVTIDACAFTHQKLLVARIVKVQQLTKNIQIRNPRVGLPDPAGFPENPDRSDSDNDIEINDEAQVTVIGGEIAAPHAYLPLRIKEDAVSRMTYLSGLSRTRIPRLLTAERDALLDTTDADVIFNKDLGASQFQMFTADNAWQGLTSSRGADALDQTGGIAESVLVSVPGLAVFRITIVTVCTVVEAAGTVSTTIKWRDRQGARTLSLAPASLAVLGQVAQEIQIFATTGSPATAITYLTTKAGGGSGQYDYHIRAERI
jgi:hypothetical protein